MSPQDELPSLLRELLALIHEARADWLNQWENLPNTLVDQAEADELDGLIKKADAVIAKAEELDGRVHNESACRPSALSP